MVGNQFVQSYLGLTLKPTKKCDELAPETVQVAKEIARIPNPGTRKSVAEAILVLVRKYFEE